MLEAVQQKSAGSLAERISSAMDGELSGHELQQFIAQAHTSDTLEDWETWHVIGDAIRRNTIRTNLVSRVAESLEAEPTILAPRRRLPVPAGKYLMPIAASVAAVAVVSLSVLRLGPAPVSHLASNTPVQTVAMARPTAARKSATLQQAAPVQQANFDQSRLASYVAAHREYTPGIDSPIMDASWQTSSEPAQ